VLRFDARRIFVRLLGAALPVALVSLVAGLLALVLLRRAAARLVRVLAGLAVAALVVGWGVAQYPYLLGGHGRIGALAVPHASLIAVTGIVRIAVALIAPSFVLLYTLQQRHLTD
jgi:cytochrome d ubiquinol oxidase subunit II